MATFSFYCLFTWINLRMVLFSCLVFQFYIASTFASINLQLSTVPVSTRTCLRVEKVQGCRPALLNMGV